MPQDDTPLFALTGQVIREPRQVSKADAEKKTRITYHRRSRTSAPANCDDCSALARVTKPGATPLRPAVYIRRHGDSTALLCFQHKQERQDSEWINQTK